MFHIFKKLQFLYDTYVLVIICIGYILAELGHYLIGATSKSIAQDLRYGDITCQLNETTYDTLGENVDCHSANSYEL